MSGFIQFFPSDLRFVIIVSPLHASDRQRYSSGVPHRRCSPDQPDRKHGSECEKHSDAEQYNREDVHGNNLKPIITDNYCDQIRSSGQSLHV